jgi:hypothetical protein
MNCLQLTLYPSITLALLDERFVKIFGVKKGVWAGDDLYISGRWYSPWRYINDAAGDLRDAVHSLAEKYGDCVGISISPGDEDLLFIVAFLTQNTNYHTNVLKWTRALFSKTEDLAEMAEVAPSIGFMRTAPRLGLRGRPPSPAHCRRYTCGTCPLAPRCLRAQAAEKLGRLAGWVQTLAYLADKGVLSI